MKRIGISIFTAPEAGGAYQYTRSILQVASLIKSQKPLEYDFVVYSEFGLWKDICDQMGLAFSKFEIQTVNKVLYHVAYILGNYGISNSKLYNRHPMWEAYTRDGLDLMFITSPTWYGRPDGKKCIIPIFDLMHHYIDFEEVGGGNVGKERDRRYKAICEYADGILADSKLGVMQIIDCYGEQINNLIAKTYSLPFIVPDYIEPNATGQKVSVPDKYILYPAQFWKHKNHISLVRAAGELKKQGVIVNLVFTGTNKNAADDINKAISEYELTEQVTNLGYISNEQLIYLYRHARAMMFPSFGGPTNIPPLEAMVFGCPVAVSNNFAMPEQVGRAGLTFAPDDQHAITDCMRRLWIDDELCDKLSANGKDRSAEWTVQEFSKILIEIIDDVMRK